MQRIRTLDHFIYQRLVARVTIIPKHMVAFANIEQPWLHGRVRVGCVKARNIDPIDGQE